VLISLRGTRGSRFHSLTCNGVGLTRSTRSWPRLVSARHPPSRISKTADIPEAACRPPKSLPSRAICAGRKGPWPQASPARHRLVWRSSPSHWGFAVDGTNPHQNARNPPGLPFAKPRGRQKEISRPPDASCGAQVLHSPYPRPRSMAKPAQENRRQKKPSAKTSPMALLTSRARFNNNIRVDHRLRQVKWISWSSAVPAVFRRSQKAPLSHAQTAAEAAGRRALDQGHAPDRSAGQGPRLRPGKHANPVPAGGRSWNHPDPRCHPPAAQRLPPSKRRRV